MKGAQYKPMTYFHHKNAEVQKLKGKKEKQYRRQEDKKVMTPHFQYYFTFFPISDKVLHLQILLTPSK